MEQQREAGVKMINIAVFFVVIAILAVPVLAIAWLLERIGVMQ